MESRKMRERFTEPVNGNLALSEYDAAKLPIKTPKCRTWIDREELLRKDRRYRYVRRTQDVILSLATLIVLLVPMLVVAFIIWIDSPGAGPFFVQKRVGRNGKAFDFINFAVWYRMRTKCWTPC